MAGIPSTTTSHNNRENLTPDPEVLSRLRKELRILSKEPLEDIRIVISETDITDVQAFLTGPADTPYSDGVFHVKLSLTGQFPSGPPRAHFITKIFHPNVATGSGEICVNTLKKDWRPEMGIKEILLTIKCLLIDPNPESALNEEAGRLLLEDYAQFARRARIYTDVHAKKTDQSSSSSLSHCSSSDNTTSSSTAQQPKRPRTETNKKTLRRL